MITQTKTSYVLDEKEIKDACRRYYIDKLGCANNFSEKDIEITAETDRDGNAINIKAELVIVKDKKQ